MTIQKSLRAAGAILWNLLVALLGTAVLESELYRMIHPQTIQARIVREDVLSATVAFVLGYFVYRIWRLASSKWLWVVGFCWFGQRAVVFWYGQRLLYRLHGGHTVSWEMSGLGCFDIQSCSDWLMYTIPSLRMIFYSIGALCCSIGSSAIEGSIRGLFRSTRSTDPVSHSEE